MLLGVELNPTENLSTFCRRLMTQLAELIEHADYPGVSVMRDLSRLHGSLQPSPVVFTAGFGIRGKTLFSERVADTFGPRLGHLRGRRSRWMRRSPTSTTAF